MTVGDIVFFAYKPEERLVVKFKFTLVYVRQIDINVTKTGDIKDYTLICSSFRNR